MCIRDRVYDLFLDLNANDEQLDFPILYGIAKRGIVQHSLDEEGTSIEPLFETIPVSYTHLFVQSPIGESTPMASP